MKQMHVVSTVPDRPIERREEDLLGRRDFAENLASLVHNSPTGSNMRMGIYGRWGEGKSSVLQMMRGYLQEHGHVCVWITPWLAESRDAVAAQLTQEIARALGIDLNRLRRAERFTTAFRKARALADVDVRTKAAEAVFGSALDHILGGHAAGTARRLTAEIGDRLGTRKLVVFVDDVDRIRPNLIPDLLLTLREALDQPDYYYILALAPDVVERGLASIHAGWGEQGQFLAKIVELPRHLPRLSAETIARYTKHLIVAAGTQIDTTAIEDLSRFLPTNPRHSKLFIRYLASIAGHVGRFSPTEFDRQALYLAQLLKFEFPEEVESLIDDPETMKDIELSFFKEFRASDVDPFGQRSENNSDGRERPERQHIDPDNPLIGRFLSLCGGLRERGIMAWGRLELRGLLLIPDEMPAITMKEAGDVADAWLSDSDPDSRRSRFTKSLAYYGGSNPEKQKAVWATFLELRENHLSAVIDKELDSELVEGIATAGQLLELIHEFWEGPYGYRASVLGVEEWKELRSHVIQWAHFSHGEQSIALRTQEWKFLEYTFDELSRADQASLAEVLRIITTRDPEPGSGYIDVAKSMRDKARRSGIEEILTRFSAPGGAEFLWGERDTNAKSLLVGPSSPIFSDPSYLARLRSIAARAGDDVSIQSNFLTFFRQLAYGATEGGSFSRPAVLRWLKRPDLLQMIWVAATIRPLNPRIAGSLREHRQAVGSLVGSVESMPLPPWWERLEASGFFRTSEDRVRRLHELDDDSEDLA